MALTQKYLPVSPGAKRVRLDLSPEEARKLSQLAAGVDLSLASYCRVLCLVALAGGVTSRQVLDTAAPLRAPSTRPVTAPEPRPRGRPRKNTQSDKKP